MHGRAVLARHVVSLAHEAGVPIPPLRPCVCVWVVQLRGPSSSCTAGLACCIRLMRIGAAALLRRSSGTCHGKSCRYWYSRYRRWPRAAWCHTPLLVVPCGARLAVLALAGRSAAVLLYYLEERCVQRTLWQSWLRRHIARGMGPCCGARKQTGTCLIRIRVRGFRRAETPCCWRAAAWPAGIKGEGPAGGNKVGDSR